MSQFVIIPKENAKNVKTILMDEEPWRDFHCAVFGYYTFEILSIEQFEILEKKKVKAFVYRKLAQKNHCSHELQKKLKECLVPKSIADAMIEECENLGYINDEDWLKSFIRGAKTKKVGPAFIMQKLMMKGFDKETAAAALKEEDLPRDRIERIKKLLQTRYRSRDLTDYKEKQKVIASLARKGFSFEDIKNALSLGHDHDHHEDYED